MLRRTFVVALAAVASAGLAACSGDRNVARDLAVAAGITGGEPRPAPDFVSRSRQPEPDYMPIGRQPPPRELRMKNKDAVTSAEGDLARARATNEARGVQARRAGATPAPTVPPKPPAPE